MTQPKDGESFFRKVARFVANPTTDWAEINSRQDDPEADMAKAELRAMVERKRRNDFVRKRELDMLRRIRREGLSPEQLAALGSASSRLDDVDGRPSEPPGNKIDPRVKDKINEIEQQMVGEAYAPTQLSQPSQQQHPPNFFETSTRPVHFAATQSTEPPPAPPAVPFPQSTRQPLAPAPARVSEFSTAEERERLSMPSHAAVTMGAGMSPLSDAKPSVLPSLHDLPPLEMSLDALPSGAGGITKGGGPAASGSSSMPPPLPASPPAQARPGELQEMVHDPELDEAVIAFANADYEFCEKSLTELVHPGGLRNLHGETWLVLFDLYRAIGSQAKFEALALEYAQQFGLSAPQWYSLPKLVAEAARAARPTVTRSSGGPATGACWTAPDYLDGEAVEQLATRCQNQPMPWVMDWGPVKQFDTEACKSLRQLLRGWAMQSVEMRWLGGDHFLALLKELTPVAVRDVDPALWMLRLEVLRVVNRPDQFDEAAIDYCVTYEVSPPSWERAQCRVRVSGARGQSTSSTGSPSSSIPTEPMNSSSFLESSIIDDAPGLPASVELELSGQLSGDISETLGRMSAELGAATVVTIACPKLIRLDFMAAGDLLNWVLSRRGENRTVIFSEAHRLVALFFGAMGINEHARVKIRLV